MHTMCLVRPRNSKLQKSVLVYTQSAQINDKKQHSFSTMVDFTNYRVNFICAIIYFCNVFASILEEISAVSRLLDDKNVTPRTYNRNKNMTLHANIGGGEGDACSIFYHCSLVKLYYLKLA